MIILTGLNQSFQSGRDLLNKRKGKPFREYDEGRGVNESIFLKKGGGEGMLALALLYQSSLLLAEN